MWQVKDGHEHTYLDGRTHVHHVHLVNPVTGGEHEIQLLLGAPVCRECRRPFAQSHLSTLNPHAEIEKAIAALRENHDAVMAYIQKHGIPVRLGPLASHVPEGHRTTQHGSVRLLHPVRTAK